MVDLETIYVDLSQCVGVDVGADLTEITRALKDLDFDYAVVYESWAERKTILGYIASNHLEQLLLSGKTLGRDDPNIVRLNDAELELTAGLDWLLDKLAERPLWFVTHEYDAEERGTHYVVHGILSRSDLNKHPLRALLYEVLAKLEIALANLINITITNPYDWIRQLNEDSQARILGYWELSKIKNVDVGPLAGAMLSDLINVIARNQSLWQKLGYPSRSSFEEEAGRLPRVRNQVMHPVRPLISDADSCIYLKDVLGRAILLTDQANSLGIRKKAKLGLST